MRKNINILYLFSGAFISAALLFLINIYAGRVFGPEDFGKFQIIISIAQILLIFLPVGVHTASVVFISKAKEEEKQGYHTSALYAFLLSVTVFTILFYFIGDFLVRLHKISEITFLTSLIFSFSLAVYYLGRSFLQAKESFIKISFLDVLYPVVIIVSYFLMKNFGYTSNLFIVLSYSFSIGYLLYGVSGIIASSKKVGELFKFKRIRIEYLKKIIHYGLLASMGSVAGIFLSNIDKLLIKYYFSDGLVGLYSVYLLGSVIIFSQLLSVIITFFLPYASQSTDKRYILDKINEKKYGIALIVAGSSCLLSSLIFVFLGKEYESSNFLILLFSLNASLIVLYQMKMWLLNSEGLIGIKISSRGMLIIGAINIILCILLIPRFGIVGVATVLILTSLLLYVYYSYYCDKIFSK